MYSRMKASNPASASSVIVTFTSMALSSMSPKRDPAASRTQPTFSSYAAALELPGFDRHHAAAGHEYPDLNDVGMPAGS